MKRRSATATSAPTAAVAMSTAGQTREVVGLVQEHDLHGDGGGDRRHDEQALPDARRPGHGGEPGADHRRQCPGPSAET